MKKLLLPVIAALIASGLAAFAAPVALLTGPLEPSQTVATLNTLINSINTNLSPNGLGNMSPALNIPSVTSAVQGLQITPAATTNPVLLNIAGTAADTNPDLIIGNTGTGKVYLGGTTTTASAQLRVTKTASSVNFFDLTGAIATASPALTCTGTDTNVGCLFSVKGTGAQFFGGTTAANASLQVATVASAVNQLVVTPAVTGTAPTLAVGGSGADANRNLGVAGNGTGIVVLGQTICTATGATPQTCNGQRGIVTTGTLTTAAATNAAFVINNTSVTTASLIQCTDQAYSGTLVTNGYPTFMSCVPGSGTITVNITNTHAANALNGTVQIGFVVLN